MSIKFSKVGFQYSRGLPWERTALKNIDLVVEKNEILGVIGPTGSGKYTLLQMMNGVLHPSEGEVLVDGKNPAKFRGREITRLRQKVGLVFQSPEDQIFENRVYDDIAFGPRNMGITGAELENRVKSAMEIMGLDFASMHQRKPQTLSGGQKRRVAIAGILALNPEYLILDEPAAGLDPLGRRKLMKLILKLRQSQGMGVVMVSHRLQDILSICDKVAILVSGEIYKIGTPVEIAEMGEELTDIGLLLPPMNLVLQKLKVSLPHLKTGLVGEEAIARGIDQALRTQ